MAAPTLCRGRRIDDTVLPIAVCRRCFHWLNADQAGPDAVAISPTVVVILDGLGGQKQMCSAHVGHHADSQGTRHVTQFPDSSNRVQPQPKAKPAYVPPPRTGPRPSNVNGRESATQIVIRLAGRPDGMTSADLAAEMGVAMPKATASIFFAEQTNGTLHRIKINGKQVRYFLHIEHAQARGELIKARSHADAEHRREAREASFERAKAARVEAATARARAQAEAAKKPARKTRGPGRPGADLVASQRGTLSPEPTRKPRADAAVIIPDNVKRTTAPTPPGRFDVSAETQLTGGFSTTRPGINPVTGSAW